MKKKRTPAQIAADKKRTGRPPKALKVKQGEKVTVYLTSAELRTLEQLAKQEGISLASLIMRPWREKGTGYGRG